ncbi:MAG: hypothetical protein HUK08_00195 [Bacteroidaceae bacterium]|nr:hypothetical protein [Bacteroidaceae bacterium]
MKQQESLSRALSYAGCRDLPKPFNPSLGLFWIKAICLVKKKSGSEEYVISEQCASGIINHVCDCGTMSPIAAIVRIYPYMYLDEGILRSCSHANREFLCLTYPDKAGSILNADKDTLAIFKKQYAIDTQKNSVNGYQEFTERDAVQQAQDEIERKAQEQKRQEAVINGEVYNASQPEYQVMDVLDEGTVIIEEVQDISEPAPEKKRRGRRGK